MLIYYSLILSSYPFAPDIFLYTNLSPPGKYASNTMHRNRVMLLRFFQSWRKRNWYKSWGRLGYTCIDRNTDIIGIAINDSVAPTYMNLIFALSLIVDMPTNKARQGRATMRRSRVIAMLFPYSILFLLFYVLCQTIHHPHEADFDFVLCCKGTHFNLITKRILSFWCVLF